MKNAASGQATQLKSSVIELALAGKKILFDTKPGHPNWNTIQPADVLVSEKVSFDSNKRVHYIGCGSGAAPVVHLLNNPFLEIWVTEPNYTALEIAKKTFQLNNIPKITINPEISLFPEQTRFFDAVIIYLPKGRKLLRRFLVEAFLTLKPGGELYLVGSNELGIQSATSDMHDLLKNKTIIAYKKGHRLIRSLKESEQDNAPNWYHEPGILPNSWIKFDAAFLGKSMQFKSLPGVFSADHLDQGSLFLINNLPDLTDSDVLDFGCGYGVIGIAAVLRNANHVDMIDNHLFAIASAKENVSSLGIQNVSIMLSDGTSAISGNKYHYLITNPPFHVAKKVDFSITKNFIKEGHEILHPGGKIILVSNQFIRYERWIENIYGYVDCIATNNQFKIWSAKKA
jgi:16S rRNA (guanine1207-N2)-methyltransferase